MLETLTKRKDIYTYNLSQYLCKLG